MMVDDWDAVSREVAKRIGEGGEYAEPEEDDGARITTEDVLRLFEVLDDWDKNHHGEDWTINLSWDDEGHMHISAVPGNDGIGNEEATDEGEGL